MKTRRHIALALGLALAGCSASHRDGIDPGVTPGPAGGPETSLCEGGLFLGETQLHNPPSFGATATGDVWFDASSEIAIASPDLAEVTPLADDPYGVSVAPEGDRIAFRRDANLVVRDLATGEEMSVPAPFTHAFGFVESASGSSRAWSCADGTLTLFADAPVTVATDVESCHQVYAVGRILHWRDVDRRLVWTLDGETELRRTADPIGTPRRTGVVQATADGRWIVHQPALECPSGETLCAFEGASYAEVFDAATGDHLLAVDLGRAGSRMRVVEARGALAIRASDGPLTLLDSDTAVRAVDGFHPLVGLDGGRFLVRGADRSVHVLSADGTIRAVVDRALELDARFVVSADGSHFAVAHPTGTCLRADDYGCPAEEWHLVIERADGEHHAERTGRGRPNLVGITDAGLTLVIGFEDPDEPEGDAFYRNRVFDPLGRALWDEQGRVSAFVVDGDQLYFALADEGLRMVNAAGSVASTDDLAEHLVVDRAAERLLRMRAFPEPEDAPADLGPPTRFCVFATPLTLPGS